MNKRTTYRMLTAGYPPRATALWLRETYFPEIIRRFNEESSRKRFGLYQGEQIPVNERNLTDVRTRMGVLIEFELARISNELLDGLKINNIFWAYVVANRFPDLEIRNNSGERKLRFEIKSLQCIAEEKSANFDTLKKDINPLTDFVVVCLWDWSKERSATYQWDSVPIIHKVYVFHAYSLTMLRDTYWLNNPPSDMGNGYQGFDIRYAVTCKNGIYSKEQGNYGKLTRIWKDEFRYRPTETEELLDTEQEYLNFQEEIIFEGFKILATTHLSSLAPNTTIEEVRENNDVIGYKAEQYIYLSSKIQNTRTNLQRIISNNNCSILVKMTEKYQPKIYKLEDNSLSLIFEDIKKPKYVLDILNQI